MARAEILTFLKESKLIIADEEHIAAIGGIVFALVAPIRAKPGSTEKVNAFRQEGVAIYENFGNGLNAAAARHNIQKATFNGGSILIFLIHHALNSVWVLAAFQAVIKRVGNGHLCFKGCSLCFFMHKLRKQV